ncbi:MAG: hypothetical protein M0R70_09050 [Nitrospirae bacterium]|nr:hypothetical protein [Nitrospirota bacterium]
MKVLFIKNDAAEGPGTIEDHLEQRSIPYDIVELHRGDPAPDVDRYSHVVIMGGGHGGI